MNEFDDIEGVLKYGHRHQISARHTVMDAGRVHDQLGYLVSGTLSVLVESSEGQEMVVDYLYPGEFFGEAGLFERKPAGMSFVARDVCEVVMMSHSRFRAYCSERPQVALALAGQLSKRLRKASRKAARSTFIDVTSRIAYALLDLARNPDAKRTPQGMEVRASKQELARLVGCSREMASRAVKELEMRTLVAVSGRSIVLLSGFSPARNPDDSAFRVDDSLVVFSEGSPPE